MLICLKSSRVTEPPEDDARRILISVIRNLEGFHKCRIALDVLPTLWELQRRYARDLALPGRVAGFLRRLAVKYATHDITRDLLLSEYHDKSGIEMGLLDTRQKLERPTIMESLGRHVVGQNDAIAALADVVSVAKARLNDTGRPLGTLLFLGPTGVGKTQAAKALAAFLFGDGQRLVRLDMNEYVDPASAARLVGTWRQPEGLLTAAIRRQPYAVVLLDEIEKAHRDVHDLLLQLLGEGRLTDALGRTADFSNAVIIMTSNLGVRETQAAFGFGRAADAAIGAGYRHAAERFFRPEFFNRIDRIVPFARLTRAETRRIANTLIDEVFRRDGLRQRRAILAVEERAMEQIVDQGYHPQFGARALKRVLEQQLTHPVAARLAAMEPGVPTVIRVYPGAGQVAVGLEPLQNAARLAGLNLDDRDAIFDAIDAAMDRIDAYLATIQPHERVVIGNVAPEHARYFAMRDQQQRVDRLFDRLMNPGQSNFGKTPKTSLRGISKRTLLRTSRTDFRDLFATDDLRQYLAALSSDAQPFGEAQDDSCAFCWANWRCCMRWPHAPAGQGDQAVLVMRSIAGRSASIQSCVAQTYDQFYLSTRFLTGKRKPEMWLKNTPAHWAALVDAPGAAAATLAEQGTHMVIAEHGIEPVQVLAIPLMHQQNPLETALELYDRDMAWHTALAEGCAEPQDDPLPLGPIIRLYETAPGGRRIIDLRTGLVLEPKSTPADKRSFGLALLPQPPEIPLSTEAHDGH